MRKNIMTASGILFLIVGGLHLIRVLKGWPILVGDYPIPMWVSFVLVVVAFTLGAQNLKLRS